MNSFDYFNDFQKSMDRYFRSMQPLSEQLINALKTDQSMFNKILLPFSGLADQISKLQSAISLPNSSLDIIKRLSESLYMQLPTYFDNFRISSAFIDSIKSMEFVVPKYFIGIDNYINSLNSVSNQLYSSLKTLTATIADTQITLDAIPDYLVKPHTSVSAHYKLLKDFKFYEYHNDDIENDIENEIRDASNVAESVISNVNKNWLKLLKGAEMSLLSKNPDKIRHAIISLRELLTQIMHTLAPDEEIKSRYKEPEWYSDKRPTRRARLHFILSNIFGNDILVDFIEKDISAILSLFEVFQKGVHSIVSNISDDQLKFIIVRVKLLIIELLK